MYIISVNPLEQIGGQGSHLISYFSTSRVTAGMIVQAPYGSRHIYAVVRYSYTTSDKRQSIKRNKYKLKKIIKIISDQPLFSLDMLYVADTLSAYYMEQPGAILKSLIPSYALSHSIVSSHTATRDSNLKYDYEEVVIGSLPERENYYKTMLRETYAKKQSMILVVPTTNLLLYYKEVFSDLSRDIIIIHGSLSSNEMHVSIAKMKASPKPRIAITTPLALGLIHHDEDILVVDDADSRYYKRFIRPKYDIREAARLLAGRMRMKYIEGKYFTSQSDLIQRNQVTYISSRVKAGSQYDIVKSHGLISQELLNMLAMSARTILYNTRKGYFTFIYCKDCGRLHSCPSCLTPVVQTRVNVNAYYCRKCQEIITPNQSCDKCGSRDLKGYGIGNQRIFAEVNNVFPKRRIWVYDDDSIKRKSERERIKKAFMKSADGILICSDLGIDDPFLKSDLAAIVSLDNLFSIPDFQINEQVLSIIMKLIEKTKTDRLLIQTKFPNHPLFASLIKHDIKPLLNNELNERKWANFPPFSLFIKVTIKAQSKSDLIKRSEGAVQLLSPYVNNISCYDSFTDKKQRVILLTLDRKNWPHNCKQLVNVLSTNKQWDVAVEPTSIL
jgi:primosomal protein N'